MNIIDQCKKAGEIRNKEASKVLLECSSKVSQQAKPPKENFLEVLDISFQVTDFQNRKSSIGSENQLVGEVLTKLCSFMYERAHNNLESKELLKELIVLCSKVYANLILNEPSPQPKTLVENKEEK